MRKHIPDLITCLVFIIPLWFIYLMDEKHWLFCGFSMAYGYEVCLLRDYLKL